MHHHSNTDREKSIFIDRHLVLANAGNVKRGGANGRTKHTQMGKNLIDKAPTVSCLIWLAALGVAADDEWRRAWAQSHFRTLRSLKSISPHLVLE